VPRSTISPPRVDQNQTVVYDVASVASAVRAARSLLAYGEHGDHEARLAHAYAADVVADLRGRLVGREGDWGTDGAALDDVAEAVAAGRDASFLAEIAETVMGTGEAGPRHLPEELEMVRDAFRRFAEDKVMPVAEHVHRDDEDIPDEIIAGLAEMGCFALSIPSRVRRLRRRAARTSCSTWCSSPRSCRAARSASPAR
jgi:(2S)-methylsuccinyl-CoA dehydrogenase